MRGALGMRKRRSSPLRSGYRFKQFKSGIGRDFFTVGDKASQIRVNRIARHGACVINGLAPCVATRKYRNRGMESALVRF